MKPNNPTLVRDAQGNIVRPEPASDGMFSFSLEREFLRRHRIIAGYEPCQYVDAYKVLRTRVLQRMRERGWKTLAVTSPNANAGKTVAAINLAVSLALEVDQTVLLVDVDLRNPSIHRYFGFTPQYGIPDHLLDRIPLENLFVHPNGIGQLRILPGNRPMINSAEMMSCPQMAQLVDSLKKSDASRLTVYDLPHLQTADALAFVPLVDAVLLVIEAGATTHDDLAQAVEHLQGVPIIGTMLNKSEPLPSR